MGTASSLAEHPRVVDALLDLILQADLDIEFTMASFNMRVDRMMEILTDKSVLVALSDGGAHVAIFDLPKNNNPSLFALLQGPTMPASQVGSAWHYPSHTAACLHRCSISTSVSTRVYRLKMI